MRLALLSDLHFGRADPDLVEPLLLSIDAADPDLVVIAGDFVQRARAEQYAKAKAFLARLSQPWLAVPGNHDIPLFNIIERIRSPRKAYRKWISEETEPLLETETAVIVGIDTTHRYSHQRGILRPRQISYVADIIRRHQAERTVIVVAHHPFHQSEDIEKRLMLGAPRALRKWADAGRHMILTGHLHRWKVEPFITRKNQSSTLQVHCGTGLSTRLRGEPNDWALIETDGTDVTITRILTSDGADSFVPARRYHYGPFQAGWQVKQTG